MKTCNLKTEIEKLLKKRERLGIWIDVGEAHLGNFLEFYLGRDDGLEGYDYELEADINSEDSFMDIDGVVPGTWDEVED